jgi:pimeloyl-ACP methyl ester carboxylesterase
MCVRSRKRTPQRLPKQALRAEKLAKQVGHWSVVLTRPSIAWRVSMDQADLPIGATTQPPGRSHIQTKWFSESSGGLRRACCAAGSTSHLRPRLCGDEPNIVLMHGFPDNLHLYDRLVPYLSPPRIVTFDFLGWGASDKPLGYPYTAEHQKEDLHSVIEQLKLGQVVLVAHDASGPPAINWALQRANQVSALVLLNTYYGAMPILRPPEAIFLSQRLSSGISHGHSQLCLITSFFGECIGGRLADSSEMLRLEINSFLYCINNSMQSRAPVQQCRNRAHAGMRHQPQRFGSLALEPA